MPKHIIKVELPPGANLLVTHSSSESEGAEQLPSGGGRQRPSRPIDPGYGVEAPEGDPNQDLPEEEKQDIRARLEEAKKAVGAKIDEIRNRPPAPGQPDNTLPSRLDAIKEAARTKIDEIKANHPDAGQGAEDLKKKISAKVDELKQAWGNRTPPDYSQKLDELKKQIGSAIQAAKDRLGNRGEGSGDCGAKLDEVRAAASAKFDELKAALGSKGQDVSQAIEEARAAIEAKIDEIRTSNVDEGYGQEAPPPEASTLPSRGGRVPGQPHR